MVLRASLLALMVASLACVHGEEKADPAPTASAASTSPGVAGPQTATATLAAASGPAVDELSPCDTDADCGFTRVGEGGCCPMLCTPRVVTKRRAADLEKNVAACNQGKECPLPLCRPPLQASTPACVEHKCVARTRAVDPRAE